MRRDVHALAHHSSRSIIGVSLPWPLMNDAIHRLRTTYVIEISPKTATLPYSPGSKGPCVMPGMS
jgi:hypothetical protein